MRLLLFGCFQGFRLRSFSGLCCGSGSSGGLGFTLAATHFTWVVWRAAVRQHYRCRFGGNRCWLDNLRLGFDCRSRLLSYWRLDRCDRCSFGNFRRFLGFTRFNRWSFDSYSLDSNLWLSSFSDRRFNHSLRHHFDNWLGARLDHGYRLAERLLDHRCGGNGLFYLGVRLRWQGDHFACRSLWGLGSGDFSLLIGLGLSFSADVAGGNGSGDG